MKNKAAVALGKLAAGVKKTYSDDEIARRTERVIKARRKHLNKRAKTRARKGKK